MKLLVSLGIHFSNVPFYETAIDFIMKLLAWFGIHFSSVRPYETPIHASRATKADDEDRITQLPNDVISMILSILPTKDSVRTSVLSQEWKYKFTSIHNIDVNYSSSMPCVHGISSLDGFMNKLLTQDDDLRIISFRLCLNNSNYGEYNPDYPRKWILQILNRNIQNLEINLYGGPILQVLVDSCFPNLKSLYLKSLTTISEKEQEQLLLTFPALEVLEMTYHVVFVNTKLVKINAPKLHTFKYGWMTADTHSHSLDLYAPELHYASFDQILVTQRRIREANAIMMGTPSLKYLDLSGGSAKALVEYWEGDPAVIPAFDQLKWLKIWSLQRVLVELLQRMPCLESLDLYIPCLQHKPMDPLPPCIVSSLKEVKFTGFFGKIREIDLIKLFVENVKSLERVVVCLAARDLRTKSNDEIKSMLETLKPVNSSCIIVLKKPGNEIEGI